MPAVFKKIFFAALFLNISLISISDNPYHTEPLKFTLLSAAGKKVSNRDFLGKITIINFSSPDSQASIIEKISFVKFMQEGISQDINFIPIILGNHTGFKDFPFQFYSDSENTLVAQLNVEIVPSTYILDHNGFLVYRHLGALDFNQFSTLIFLLQDKFRGGPR